MHQIGGTPGDIKPDNMVVNPLMLGGGPGPLCHYLDMGLMVAGTAVFFTSLLVLHMDSCHFLRCSHPLLLVLSEHCCMFCIPFRIAFSFSCLFCTPLRASFPCCTALNACIGSKSLPQTTSAPSSGCKCTICVISVCYYSSHGVWMAYQAMITASSQPHVSNIEHWTLSYLQTSILCFFSSCVCAFIDCVTAQLDTEWHTKPRLGQIHGHKAQGAQKAQRHPQQHA